MLREMFVLLLENERLTKALAFTDNLVLRLAERVDTFKTLYESEIRAHQRTARELAGANSELGQRILAVRHERDNALSDLRTSFKNAQRLREQNARLLDHNTRMHQELSDANERINNLTTGAKLAREREERLKAAIKKTVHSLGGVTIEELLPKPFLAEMSIGYRVEKNPVVFTVTKD